jgi:hypothetical protein
MISSYKVVGEMLVLGRKNAGLAIDTYAQMMAVGASIMATVPRESTADHCQNLSNRPPQPAPVPSCEPAKLAF